LGKRIVLPRKKGRSRGKRMKVGAEPKITQKGQKRKGVLCGVTTNLMDMQWF